MASVLKRGGFWYAKWTDATGKRCRERIEASSKAQAKALADELEVEARRHRNLARRVRNGLPPRPEDLTGTFADLCTWWLDHRSRRRAGVASASDWGSMWSRNLWVRCRWPRSALLTSTSCFTTQSRQARRLQASTSSAASCTRSSRRRKRPAGGWARIPSRPPSGARSRAASTRPSAPKRFRCSWRRFRPTGGRSSLQHSGPACGAASCSLSGRATSTCRWARSWSRAQTSGKRRRAVMPTSSPLRRRSSPS